LVLLNQTLLFAPMLALLKPAMSSVMCAVKWMTVGSVAGTTTDGPVNETSCGVVWSTMRRFGKPAEPRSGDVYFSGLPDTQSSVTLTFHEALAASVIWPTARDSRNVPSCGVPDRRVKFCALAVVPPPLLMPTEPSLNPDWSSVTWSVNWMIVGSADGAT